MFERELFEKKNIDSMTRIITIFSEYFSRICHYFCSTFFPYKHCLINRKEQGLVFKASDYSFKNC